MTNLFGETYTEMPVNNLKRRQDNRRRVWENGFQRWSDEKSQDGSTPLGKCGYGSICDYCTDPSYGRPCVRALNAMCREKGKEVDYTDRDYERWF